MFKVSRPCENEHFVGDIAGVTDERLPSNGQELDIDWNLLGESVNKYSPTMKNKNGKDTDDSVDEFEGAIDPEKKLVPLLMNNAKMYDMFFAPRDQRKPRQQYSDDDWRTTMQPCAD